MRVEQEQTPCAKATGTIFKKGTLYFVRSDADGAVNSLHFSANQSGAWKGRDIFTPFREGDRIEYFQTRYQAREVRFLPSETPSGA